ncbi:NACHT, LRR and PYD domains-containing protein 12-like isoform X1 [Esox lucius]|uniref:B30.2/SPRY domain-containing protein n=1 Tax=Esox lucius TaxID=8010 RepID=A0A6Q2ZKT4_ESOLU|nr:NACHT, LRR and PYD domains-containing protein 12-like isoform X1 [Esox lucius]
MSFSGERERGTASKRRYSGTEEATTASIRSISGEKNIKSEVARVCKERAESLAPSCLSMKSDRSMSLPEYFRKTDFPTTQCMDNGGEFTMKSMPTKCQTILRVHQEMKTELKQKFQLMCEGIGHHGNFQTLFKGIYTELYITEGGSGWVNNEHELRQTEFKRQTTQETSIKCNNIFKPLPGQNKPIRTVLTKGIAGIGKTVSVQKVILDWAEGTANQDVNLMFLLPFRDLNLKKDQYSLMQLLTYYYPGLKEIDSFEDGETKTVFIFDGLDECRLPLDFKNNKKCYDVTQSTSVDVLLTNLIKGNLLPSALVWITTRPAAANQVPPECVDRLTEIQGFNERQKEEYFRKKVIDDILANEIIKHIKSSRSLHIMCHIPVFCWISAIVLEEMLKEAENNEIPKTLTQMYEHFLLIQTCMKNKEYNKPTKTNPNELSQSDKQMILKLAELAFQQLLKGNLIFYEEDLRECGINVTEASEYSAICTEIFKEVSGLYQDKVFSFVHLSIQEFLAAVHALESFLGEKENVFSTTSDDDNKVRELFKLSDLHESAVNQALKSENGHLDLFLCFLLGLSLESNQNLLQTLLTQTGRTKQSNEESVKRTIEYLTDKIKKESSPERIINLFHCLNELNANSLVNKMQTSLRSGTISGTWLQPHQCSALAYLLLISEEVLVDFDLKMYNTSEEGYQRLLPVVKTCKKALLYGCNLTYKSCETLASALQTANSPLRELDVSYNHLGDRGVEVLCAGLTSPLCKIHTLVLAGCDLKSCEMLASALQTSNCPVRDLDLSYNHLEDRGVKLLCAGLTSSLCNIQKIVLGHCGLTEGCCSDIASVLRSPNSQLEQLDLKNNDLKDSGVTLLSAGLEDPNCKLHTLGLSGCLVTEEGCASLASALQSNPSHLRELDLRYNHPGHSEVKMYRRPTNIITDHGGEFRLKSGLRKYACVLKLDPNTAHRNLSLSEGNRTVTEGEKKPYPDHPERFEYCYQVLCREGLTGRCYWEVMRTGEAGIAVTYKGINRKENGEGSRFGYNNKSWCLDYCSNSYTARHNVNFTMIPVLSWSNKVGVYLDWPAGTLSFYNISSDTVTHIYTFHSTFTEPLYPGFWVNSSVSLCQVE